VLYRIAFDLEPLNELRWFEFFFDIVILLNIVSIFFTATFEDAELIKSYKMIAKAYFSSYFFLDSLSCIPGIVTGEQKHGIYYFKVLRYFRIESLFSIIAMLEDKLKNYFIKHAERFHNFFVILK
jgi:hypothetical protein